MNKTLAPSLKKGSVIGIFSPGRPAMSWDPELTLQIIRFMEKSGYRIKPGALSGAKRSYRSGTIRERAEELNALIRDPEVDCIMASAGGTVTSSILPYIDYNALKKHPKVIVGFSDITSVLLAIYAKTGLVTFYGPNLNTSLAQIPPFSTDTLSYLEKVVDGSTSFPYTLPTPKFWTDEVIRIDTPGYSCKTQENKLITLRGGQANGRLLGGRMDSLLGFFGTQYMPEIRYGDILLLEDVGRNPEEIERSLSLLANAGAFEKIGGLILGKHANYDERLYGCSALDAAMEILDRHSFPILAEFDCSHTKPMLTMPIGADVHLDAYAQTVTILESPVR